MANAGIDVLGLHCIGGSNAHEHLENDINNLFCKNEYRELIDYAKSKGLEIEYSLHAMSCLLPRTLFESHPEYFRCDETGARTKKYNFCPSNEQPLNMVADNAATLAKKFYGSKTIVIIFG